MAISFILAVPPFVSALLSAALGGFVFVQNVRAAINFIFFALCSSLALYNVGVGALYLSGDPARAAGWAAMALYGPIMALALLPHFALAFLSLYERPASRVMVWLFYALAAIFAYANGARRMIFGVHDSPIGPVADIGVAFWCFGAAMFVSVACSLYVFARHYRDAADGEMRLRIRHVFLGIAVCSLLGLFDIAKKFAGVHANFSTFEYGIILFCVLTAYAVVRHSFMQIEFALSRGLLYSFLMLSAAVIFVLVGVALEQLTQSWLGANSTLANFATALVIAFLFEPIKDSLSRVLNKYFFPRIMNVEDAADDLVTSNQGILRSIADGDAEKLRALRDRLDSILRKYDGK